MNPTNEKSSLEIILPWPPSVNHYWLERAVGKRVMKCIGAKGKQFRKDVVDAITNATKFHCEKYFKKPHRLSVSVCVISPDRRRRDIDNLCKALLDALEHAGCYDDDCQIDRLLLIRDIKQVHPPGGVKVTIAQILED